MQTALDQHQQSSKEHALGLLAMEQKDFGLAVSRFAEAIRMAGPVPGYCRNLGKALQACGRLSQSATCYEQAIAGNPRNVELHLDLARVLIQDNRAPDAVTHLRRAVTLVPEAGEAWAFLGGALSLSEQPAQAAEALERATELDPGRASFHFDLGLVLGQLGDLNGAEAAYRRALKVNPGFPEALNNLGNLLRRRDATAEAVTCFQRAIRCRPAYTDAKYNLGLALQRLDRLEEAAESYRCVLQDAPDHAAASNNYANVLMGLGRIHEALAHYEHAIWLAPANREYRVNIGMAQLLLGDFREGWRNYGARVAPSLPGAKLWTGEHLRDKSILLVGEQGLGDTIQFIRFARHLEAEGARVQALCPAPLAGVLRTVKGLEQVAPNDGNPPPCDCYVPLMHVPAILGTRPGTIPAEIPYLFAEPARAHDWKQAFEAPTTNLRVGIAWRGDPAHWNDRNRSMSPACLAPLRRLPSVTFISLQKDFPAGCDALEFTPLRRPLGDFADTAALMTHLDLVISVDTSVAHLGGALGRPTWLLLPLAPDWRWMLERNDSLWYPGMRLFRQKRRGEWRPVLEEVREALLKLGGRKAGV